MDNLQSLKEAKFTECIRGYKWSIYSTHGFLGPCGGWELSQDLPSRWGTWCAGSWALSLCLVLYAMHNDLFVTKALSQALPESLWAVAHLQATHGKPSKPEQWGKPAQVGFLPHSMSLHCPAVNARVSGFASKFPSHTELNHLLPHLCFNFLT